MEKRYPAKLLWDYLEGYRYRNNLSQKELCDRIGWHPPFYSKLKIGGQKIDVNTVMKVKEALNVSFDDIISSSKVKVTETLSKYPAEMIDWMATEEGMKYIADGFKEYVIAQAQKQIDNVLKKMP